MPHCFVSSVPWVRVGKAKQQEQLSEAILARAHQETQGRIFNMPAAHDEMIQPENTMPCVSAEVPCLNYFFKDRVTDEPKLLHLHPGKDKDIVMGILEELREHGHSESVFVSSQPQDQVGFTTKDFTKEYAQCIAVLDPDLAMHFNLELF